MNIASQEVIAGNGEMITGTVKMDLPWQFKQKLLNSRETLLLLKETNLFGPILNKSLDDMDFLIKKADELAEFKLLEIRIKVGVPTDS